MIINVEQLQKRQIGKNLSWQTQFKLALIQKNNLALTSKPIQDPFQKKLESLADQKFQKALLKINPDKNSQVYQADEHQYSHSYYSSYIPLRIHYPVEDQYCDIFPYLRHLQENGRVDEKDKYYAEITNDIKIGKQTGTLVKKLQQCYEKFLPDIGDLDAIELYGELLSKGTGAITQVYKKAKAKCKKQIFFHRLCQSNNFFKNTQKTRKQISVSIDSFQNVTLTNLAKTSKNLLCSVCLIYDCGFHKIDDNVADNNFEYFHPRNVCSIQIKVKKAVELINFYTKKIELKQTQFSLLQNQQNFQQLIALCGDQCYKNLNKQKYSKIAFQRGIILPSVVQAFLQMGIRFFSFDPCKITKLFFCDKTQNKISCSLVFYYLLQQYHLFQRFENKFYESQYQMLMNQITFQIDSVTPVQIKSNKKKNKIKRKNPRFLTENLKDKNFDVPTCFHHFLEKEAQDIECKNCICYKRGFCLPQCLCSQKCSIMKVGCTCKDKQECRSIKCGCFLSKTQCQPMVCKNCFSNPINQAKKKNCCHNDKIMRRSLKLIRIGISTIQGAGLGAFAGQDIQPDQLINIYTGEIINHHIQTMREDTARDISFYNFASPCGIIDARFMGNKTRFINHANNQKANIRAQNVFTQGNEIVAFYAQKKILKGQQLFFNYDGEGILEKNFKEKYPFISSNQSKNTK